MAEVLSTPMPSTTPRSMAESSSIGSETSALDPITAQTTPLNHEPQFSGSHEMLEDASPAPNTARPEIDGKYQLQATDNSLHQGGGGEQSQNGATTPPAPPATTIKARLLESNDEFWSSSAERQGMRKELLDYVNFLEGTNAQLQFDTTAGLYGSFPPQPGLPLMSEPILETEWRLELSRERTVQSAGGFDNLPVDDSGDLEEQNQRTRPTGGPVLKRTREFDSKYTHTGTKMEVRSSILVDALRETISADQHHEYVALHYDPVVFRDPYMLLFHYWAEIEAQIEVSEGAKKDQLEFLLSSLDQECPAIGRFAKDLAKKSARSVPFQALWVLYRPGTTVFSRVDGHLRAYVVSSVSGCTKLSQGSFSPLKLDLRNTTAATAGKGFTSTYSSAYVDAYAEEKEIGELEYVPAGYLPDEQGQRRMLTERGERYAKFMTGPQVMDYQGNEWKKTWEDDIARVVIDVSMETAPPRARDQAGDNPFSSGQPYADPYKDPYSSYTTPYAIAGCGCSRCTGKDRHKASAPMPGCMCSLCTGTSGAHGMDWRANEVHLYLPPDIFAFSLVRKSWRSVAIDELKLPVFEETMMSKKLVLPEGHGEVVTSLVNSYTKGDLRFSDFIKGKGRGLVILLHGSPGTGKTLTAECVAEQAKRPLYSITCGDLGVESNKLESELRQIFDRATKWNAVLLLDEADVFLQERDIRNLERNALVSVFLRELEYFDGILFLTTNRPGQLDEAFQSRIHITLAMPSLDSVAQLKVWNTFLKAVILDRNELKTCLKEIKKETAYNSLNGRQIRNCVRSALSLAAQGGVTVSMEHIRRVLQLTKKFTDYMKDLHGHTGDERQSILGSRGK